MAYATLTEFKSRLGSNTTPPGVYEQLTDRITATVADDAVGQALVDEADAEVNGYLSKRYAVPVDVSSDTTLADRLKVATLDLAEHKAWETTPMRKTVPDRVQRLYDHAILWLKGVAAGRLSLPGQAEIPAATADGPTATAIGHARVFDEDGMAGL